MQLHMLEDKYERSFLHLRLPAVFIARRKDIRDGGKTVHIVFKGTVAWNGFWLNTTHLYRKKGSKKFSWRTIIYRDIHSFVYLRVFFLYSAYFETILCTANAALNFPYALSSYSWNTQKEWRIHRKKFSLSTMHGFNGTVFWQKSNGD